MVGSASVVELSSVVRSASVVGAAAVEIVDPLSVVATGVMDSRATTWRHTVINYS